jgi:hypothetical protein
VIKSGSGRPKKALGDAAKALETGKYEKTFLKSNSGFPKIYFKNLETISLSPVLCQKGVFMVGNVLHLTLRYWDGIYCIFFSFICIPRNFFRYYAKL